VTRVHELANCDTTQNARSWLTRCGIAPAFVGAALAGISVITACTHVATTIEIDKSMILPAGAAQLEVPSDQTFLMAGPLSNPLPGYPSGLVATAKDAIAVCAEFVVEADGSVRTVTPLFALPECPLSQADVDPRYVAAVADAVRQWQFFAAATCRFPPGMAKNDTCDGEGVVVTPVAIKLAYVFTFHAERGHGSVSGKSTKQQRGA
jgi:hypothetical protein